jgi:hypothetical protein
MGYKIYSIINHFYFIIFFNIYGQSFDYDLRHIDWYCIYNVKKTKNYR